MIIYAEWNPTCFDTAGAFLPNRSHWLVVDVHRNRDSGAMAESNFQIALDMLGGESDTVEVHRFGHWAVGWFEIILVDPASPQATVAESIEESLENYPWLDEEDFSEREYGAYAESWDLWGANDFRHAIKAQLGIDATCYPSLDSRLDALDQNTLREYFESLNPCGDYYWSESSGVHINIKRSVSEVTLGNLLPYIRHNKKG